jgi:thiol:disulfide interchange protein DsbA
LTISDFTNLKLKNMTLKKKFVVATFISLVTVCGTAFASITNPEAGKEYKVLAQPQPTDSAGKIEIIEFFAYWCPHCNTLDPILADWVKKKAATISFKRVHISYYDNQQPFQRLFYTLEAIGKEEDVHGRIFKAIHVDRRPVRSDEDMERLVTDFGIDPKKYVETSKSFSIAAKITRAQAMQLAYKVNDVGVPTIFVDGKYMTSPGFIRDLNPPMNDEEGSRNMLPTLDYLVQKAQKEHASPK